MAEKPLTTENLTDFKSAQENARTEQVMNNQRVGNGQVQGKDFKWDYSEGKKL